MDFLLNGCPGSFFFSDNSGASIPTRRMVDVVPLFVTLMVSPSLTRVHLKFVAWEKHTKRKRFNTKSEIEAFI